MELVEQLKKLTLEWKEYMHKNTTVISIDGNVNAGKTSLLKAIVFMNNLLNIKYVPEHTDLLDPNIEESLSFIMLQEKYLNTELVKYDIINNSSADLFLMDRSFISIFAHTLATTSRISKERIFVVNKLCELIESKRIIIPNCFVFFDVKYEVCINRYNNNHKAKGTSLDLVDPIYFNFLQNFYREWVKLVGGHMISSHDEFQIDNLRYTSYDRLLIIDLIENISKVNS
ncbi:MAG: hypothetical protein A2W90_19185 [Bacteroidetes bacterium GWF2_42_66]|nr:MAG: hypothetical protein A2W92_06000 [Bacteroidetes bacterium GWA2_42_15]OFX98707.1 MAG: hypothetical protein A2W89_10505 [Bacteroidetes bacterium GWE2_42_39]OFY43094.1 MAG: hypothetical protein A2W90_19185 [Bacteroidetes bacterium GWF2_42_66]HBL77060.1 hypothetical protein [Prolixibacteraceae bacterium]HCU59886.1 hypothetical protein [Prolixibacteraceae bacterium]